MLSSSMITDGAGCVFEMDFVGEKYPWGVFVMRCHVQRKTTGGRLNMSLLLTSTLKSTESTWRFICSSLESLKTDVLSDVTASSYFHTSIWWLFGNVKLTIWKVNLSSSLSLLHLWHRPCIPLSWNTKNSFSSSTCQRNEPSWTFNSSACDVTFMKCIFYTEKHYRIFALPPHPHHHLSSVITRTQSFIDTTYNVQCTQPVVSVWRALSNSLSLSPVLTIVRMGGAGGTHGLISRMKNDLVCRRRNSCDNWLQF